MKNITLARHIKWVIGNRIILCLALLSVVVLISSLADITSGYKQLHVKLNNEARDIAEYIIAQSLISNEPGIEIKIKELNAANRQEKFEWRAGIQTVKEPKIKWALPFSWVYLYPVHDNDGIEYGVIQISGQLLYYNSILFQLIIKVLLLLIFSLFIFLLLYPLSSRIPRDLFIVPIMSLLILLRNRSNNLDKQKDILLPLELREIQTKIIELIDELTANARKIALGRMAAQVAHDIRSPLGVLDVAMKSFTAIPEEQKLLMRNAIGHIHAIANSLLSLHKEETLNQPNEENLPRHIASLLLYAISEKRIQNEAINFDIDIKEQASCAFSNISSSTLKRVISNVLNNAIEAIDLTKGLIRITLLSVENNITISIEDNGCGITPKILQNIHDGKTITSKRKGHGLGLSYAFSAIESFQGKLNVHSHVGKGTKIDIILPRTPAPQWFASNLVISSTLTIVILDNNDVIHNVWRDRFKKINPLLKIIHFYFAEELSEWYQDHLLEPTLFLITFELTEHNQTGLEIITQLNISPYSFLVTHFHEESELQSRCNQLNLRMLPKIFAPHIPISSQAEDDFNSDLIFIDDNKILRKAWILRAKITGKNIATYESIAAFKKDLLHITKKDIGIYIDYDLGEGTKGQDFARELYKQGFSNIYLSTGYQKDYFSDTPWIKAVIGKEPPF